MHTRLMSVWIPAYFDLQAGIVIKGKPLGTEEGVRCCQVLVPLQRPVASAQQLAHLVIIMIIMMVMMEEVMMVMVVMPSSFLGWHTWP